MESSWRPIGGLSWDFGVCGGIGHTWRDPRVIVGGSGHAGGALRVSLYAKEPHGGAAVSFLGTWAAYGGTEGPGVTPRPH